MKKQNDAAQEKQRELTSNGYYTAPKPPYGYKIQKITRPNGEEVKKLKPYQPEADIVRLRNTGKRRKKTEEAEMISVSEAAALTGISDRTLRRMCVAGDIPGVQLVGKTHVIPRYWAENCAEAVNRSVSYNEAAEIAGVTVQAISTAAIGGRLQRVGKRITKDSLNKYIERRQK